MAAGAKEGHGGVDGQDDAFGWDEDEAGADEDGVAVVGFLERGGGDVELNLVGVVGQEGADFGWGADVLKKARKPVGVSSMPEVPRAKNSAPRSSAWDGGISGMKTDQMILGYY